MGISAGPATPAQLLESLRVRELEPSDFGALVQWLTGAQVSYLCVAAGHLRRAGLTESIDWTQGTIVAANGNEIVGFARIERGPDATTAHLTVAIDPTWARGPAAAKLLAAAVALARRLGVAKLETQVCRQTPFTLFRDANLRTLSSMSMGGVTDLALAVA